MIECTKTKQISSGRYISFPHPLRTALLRGQKGISHVYCIIIIVWSLCGLLSFYWPSMPGYDIPIPEL